MFTSEEIKFMQSIGLNFDFNHLSEKDMEEIEDAVADRLEYDGLDKDYMPTTIGKLCEDILYKIT